MADFRSLGSSPILVAVLAMSCLANVRASVQETAPFTETWITNIRADPARCNLGRARRVALVALARDYRSMLGRRVAVRGYWGGGALFLHARDANASDALYADRFAGSRIGLYGRREIMDVNYTRSRLEVTAVGMVGDCGRFSGPGVSVMGYCDATLDAPYLALAEMYLEP
jgi:hypothetical protein